MKRNVYVLYRLSVRVGSHFNDLTELQQVELNEPSGWIIIHLQEPSGSDTEPTTASAVRAFMVQIAVLSNHQNGRDTHLRHIKIHSPVYDATGSARRQPTFTTVQMQQYATIRWSCNIPLDSGRHLE